MSEKQDKGTATQRRHRLNIGLIVFAAIFVYMVANLFMYLIRDHVSFFEVEQGQIIDENRFTGFILRDEQVVKTSTSGYINFYVNSGDIAAKNEAVCQITKADSSDSASSSSDTTYTLTDADYSNVRDLMQNFGKSYSDANYNEVSNLKYNLGNVVNQIVSRNNLKGTDSSSGEAITTTDSGVISYTIDGLESYTEKDMSSELFTDSAKSYSRTQISAGSYLEAKSDAFKVIDSDNWSIVILPDSDELERICQYIYDANKGSSGSGDTTVSSETSDSPSSSETSSSISADDVSGLSAEIDVSFVREDITSTATISLFESNGSTFAKLDFTNYMVRFCNDRYVDIDLVWNSYSGLKVPTSSITKRDYYMIPIDFLVRDSESSQEGFYVQGDSGVEFVKPTIGYEDENFCYVDPDDMGSGTVLVNNNTGETFTVEATGALDGVYNINRGYTRFCPVNILYQYGDYSIVENAYTKNLSLYDRIVLDGSKTQNNQIVY